MIPIGPVAYEVVFRNKFIVSAIKFKKKVLKAYVTNNPVGETQSLKVYFGR